MKYLAVFDDVMIRSLRRVDDGLTIVLYDEDGNIRQTRLKPIQRYVLTMPDGTSIYLTDDHMEALKEYEKKKMHEEAVNRVLDSIKQMAILEPPFKDIKVIDFEKPREEGEK